MKINFLERHPVIKDLAGIVVFFAAVIIGAWLINSFVFRSFSVSGPSMEPTLYTGDRLIVNRLPITGDRLLGRTYVPERGQVIVFKNPHFEPGMQDEFIVKRVIGLPGERVVVKDGQMTVYNSAQPDGFNPDKLVDGADGPTSPTFGNVNTVVPPSQLFVAGDHRQEGYSLDSRDGLGTIPLDDVIGPVAFRIYPFDRARSF
ncbi:MAG TPA: signal peptidase I [Candidatus Saccharimonadales bacterium]|nr:signal peptidase I [Candidatus Saccharimonadales bacterium]